MFAGQSISLTPSLASQLNVFVALAPVVYLRNIQSMGLKYLAEFDAGDLLLMLGLNEFPPGFADQVIRLLFKEFCDYNIDICNTLETFISGGLAVSIYS